MLINSGIYFTIEGISLFYTLRYYLDIISYIYILLNILVFLLFKSVYLLFAWVCCPGVYLKVKKIIDW